MESKKESNTDNNKKSLMTIESRRKLLLTGVSEVVSFNDEQIILNTNVGSLVIRGRELKMNKLDVQNGDIVIIGIINSCIYNSSEDKHNKDTILSRLFR